jgi:methyltransferase (TIGR00027 family)
MPDRPLSQDSRLGAVAKTALWTAAARARESQRPDHLFADPFAELLAGDEGTALLRHFDTSHASAEGNPFLAIRTRWFDERITAAVRAGRRQVVALAAGLDTRAYRLDWPARTLLFELDQDCLISYKEERLADLAVARCEVRRLRVDLDDCWGTTLLSAGYDLSQPTVWFVEGLLFYLQDSVAQQLLSRAAGLSAAGSTLAADFVGTGIFRFPYMRPLLRKLAEAGSPWQFGIDDPGAFTEACGWSRVEVTEPGSPGADFGRWAPQAPAEVMPDLPRSYLVSAERGSSVQVRARDT